MIYNWEEQLICQKDLSKLKKRTGKEPYAVQQGEVPNPAPEKTSFHAPMYAEV